MVPVRKSSNTGQSGKIQRTVCRVGPLDARLDPTRCGAEAYMEFAAESVKPGETGQATNSVLMFSFAGSLIQAAFGSLGGVGGRRNRPGLAA